jgi:hypothetical protein
LFTTGESDKTDDFFAVICNAGRWDGILLCPRYEDSVLGPLSVVVSRVCSHLYGPAAIVLFLYTQHVSSGGIGCHWWQREWISSVLL